MSAIETCTHARRHEHGTYNAYRVCRCRCAECLAAGREYMARQQRARTGYRPRIDAALVRRYARRLLASGWRRNELARAAGINEETLRRIVTDQGTIRQDTAAKLVAVQPKRGLPTPLGTQRRLQALHYNGWTWHQINEHVHFGRQHLSLVAQGTYPKAISQGAVERIADVYERLWDQPPPHPRNKSDQAGITRASNFSRAHGWAPPAAWDDIDRDPAPAEGWQRTSTRNNAADVIELIEHGETPEAIAQRLGIAPRSVERAWHRRPRTAA